MTTAEMIGLVVAMLVMSAGMLGSVLPGLPSTPLVLIAAIGHRIYFGQNSISNLVLVILVSITLFSLVVDFLASMLGAKKLGATWRGVLGAVIGAVVGIFFALPGLILGPFIGALIFELMGGRNFPDSARAGAGAVIGLLVGAVGKLACCVVMMVLFFFNVLGRSTDAEEIVPEGLQAMAAWLTQMPASLVSWF